MATYQSETYKSVTSEDIHEEFDLVQSTTVQEPILLYLQNFAFILLCKCGAIWRELGARLKTARGKEHAVNSK